MFTFPAIHAQARLRVALQRTLPVPDDGRTYPVPPGLGAFPARTRASGPQEARNPQADGDTPVLELPMHQSEALWIAFGGGGYPMRVRVVAGTIHAVSGDRVKHGSGGSPEGTFPREPQGYVVVPEQPWLDGFRSTGGRVQQFVAEPLGEGHTAEEQLDPDTAP